MTALLNLLPLGISLLTSISNAWGSATGSSLQKVESVLAAESAPLLNILSAVGAYWFPSLNPTLHAAAVALLAAEQHTGATAWIQGALNVAQAAGVVQFTGTGTTGNTPLVVDGKYGRHTQGAILALQAHLGVPATGMFADAEVSALQALLSKQ